MYFELYAVLQLQMKKKHLSDTVNSLHISRTALVFLSENIDRLEMFHFLKANTYSALISRTKTIFFYYMNSYFFYLNQLGNYCNSLSILLPSKLVSFPIQKFRFDLSRSFSFFLNKTGVSLHVVLDPLVSMFQTCISRYLDKL